jgi:hypothetical protein
MILPTNYRFLLDITEWFYNIFVTIIIVVFKGNNFFGFER